MAGSLALPGEPFPVFAQRLVALVPAFGQLLIDPGQLGPEQFRVGLDCRQAGAATGHGGFVEAAYALAERLFAVRATEFHDLVVEHRIHDFSFSFLRRIS